MIRFIALIALAALSVHGQISVSNRTDLGAVDASGAASTKPAKVGSSIPGACGQGELFFRTGVTAGQNIYGCTSTNVFTLESGGGSATVDATSIGDATYFITSGSGAAYTGAPATPPASLHTGQIFYPTFNTPSTSTTPTISVNSLTAIVMVHDNGSALVVGEIGTSGYCKLYYDGTHFQITGSCLTGPATITLISNTSLAIPSAGTGNLGFDGTAKVLKAKASDGTNSATVIDKTCTAGQFVDDITGGVATCASAGAGGSGFCDPTDYRDLCVDHFFWRSGFSSGADGVSYGGFCTSGTGSGNGLDSISVAQLLYFQTSANNTNCMFAMPGGDGTINGNYAHFGIYDFLSGSTPKPFRAGCIVQDRDANGDLYCGFFIGNTLPAIGTFLGCRYTPSNGFLRAVIRGSGSDIATANVTFTQDNLTHALVLDNNSGTANTIRCSVDGGTPAVASGTIPPNTYWSYALMLSANGVSVATGAASRMWMFKAH